MTKQHTDLFKLFGGKYNLYLLGIALFVLLLFVLFFNPIARTIKILGVIAIFTIINTFLKRGMLAFQGLPLEIEVATLGSVVTTVLFGIKVGILTAVLTTFIASQLTRGISLYTPMMASGYVLAALMAWFVVPVSIATGGIVITIIVNAYLIVIFHMVGYSLLENFMYGMSNIMLNAILFLKIAPWLMHVLT
ncbi:hypothetical protein HY488_00850 [Candidatus Woesearchaeota archaeon]|nr:hypothetical protein [Candidatus Woesearchaeota archaeon]